MIQEVQQQAKLLLHNIANKNDITGRYRATNAFAQGIKVENITQVAVAITQPTPLIKITPKQSFSSFYYKFVKLDNTFRKLAQCSCLPDGWKLPRRIELEQNHELQVFALCMSLALTSLSKLVSCFPFCRLVL